MPGPDRRVLETAEAISGALYRLDFKHLGDTDAGRTTWFTRGDVTAKTVRISVERAVLYPSVFVAIEYLNSSVTPPKVGRVVLQLDCNAPRDEVRVESEKVVRRCLEIYRDVLTGTGVASREAYLASRRN